MRIALVNGINTHGEGNVDNFIEPLTSLGHEVIDIALPKRHTFSARYGAKHDAGIIYRNTEQYDAVIAHSFGGLRTLVAAERRRFSHIFLFRPALSRNYNLDKIAGTPRIHCFYSPQDVAVRIGSYLLCHPFGRAGTHGMTDPAIYNHKSTGGHSNDFKDPLFSKWVSFIHEELS